MEPMHVLRTFAKHVFFCLSSFTVMGLQFGVPFTLAQTPTSTYNVGFRIIDLDYPTSQPGEKLTVAVWYPSTATPKTFTYGGPTQGHVAVDGSPASQHGPFPCWSFHMAMAGSDIAPCFSPNLSRLRDGWWWPPSIMTCTSSKVMLPALEEWPSQEIPA